MAILLTIMTLMSCLWQQGAASTLCSELVGEDRLIRAHRKVGLSPDAPLTRENAHKLFIGLMDIQKEDIDELSEGGTAERYAHLISFENFDAFEQAFLVGSPNIGALKLDRVRTSGKGFAGLVERVSILAHHHFTVIGERDEKAEIYRDVELLTSRLADREIQEGTVVHLHDGYFYADRVFAKGGAYVAVLLDMEERNPPKIVCRGTALRKGATGALATGVNNLQLELGTKGVKSIWPNLSRYFRKKQITRAEILGKSLGGAHAQQLAVLLEGKGGIEVTQLTTYCSVGAGEGVNRLFKERVLRGRPTPFHIRVIRNGGGIRGKGTDYVPAVGGVHLGAGTGEAQCQIEVVYIHTDAEVNHYPLAKGHLQWIPPFVGSFRTSHCRQTTLQDFSWDEVKGKDLIDRHLRVGTRLEPIRRSCAWIINIATLNAFNRKCFRDHFFQSSQSPTRKEGSPHRELRCHSLERRLAYWPHSSGSPPLQHKSGWNGWLA